MIKTKVNDHEYSVELYDYVRSEEFIAGSIKRNYLIDSPETCDSYYWMFYVTDYNHPLCAGYLNSIYETLSKLNTKLDMESGRYDKD